MNNEEWRALYLYLLERLAQIQSSPEIQLDELMDEIQIAASVRIHDQVEEVGNGKFERSQLKLLHELDASTTRSSTAQEAFINVMSVLSTRLTEVPELITQLETKLGRRSSEIIWLPDIDGSEVVTRELGFVAQELQISDSEHQEIKSVLSNLERLIRQASDVYTR